MRLAPCLILASALCACGGMQALASSQFEGDDEGWTLSGNGDGTAPLLDASGGNPAGNICGQDQKDGDTWYFVAPQKYLGDRSRGYGLRLTFDLRQGAIFNQIRGRDLVLNGGGESVTSNFRTAPGLDWTPYSVRLDDQSGWLHEDGTQPAPPATEDTLRTVLRNLTSLRIRGEFYDGPNDTACLDNVYFGTP